MTPAQAQEAILNQARAQLANPALAGDVPGGQRLTGVPFPRQVITAMRPVPGVQPSAEAPFSFRPPGGGAAGTGGPGSGASGEGVPGGGGGGGGGAGGGGGPGGGGQGQGQGRFGAPTEQTLPPGLARQAQRQFGPPIFLDQFLPTIRNWIGYVASIFGQSTANGLPLPPAPILPEIEVLINPLGEQLSEGEKWARLLQLLSSYDPSVHQAMIGLRFDAANQQWFRVATPMLQNLRELT